MMWRRLIAIGLFALSAYAACACASRPERPDDESLANMLQQQEQRTQDIVEANTLDEARVAAIAAMDLQSRIRERVLAMLAAVDFLYHQTTTD